MPFSSADASRHTRKAKTPKSRRAFAHAANSVLERTGDEGRAVRAGNAAAARSAAKSSRKQRRSSRK
jgi:hypothetical protein